ncbi:MAG: sulfatase-like hydrolase/transferase [Duncaniella sp.]|nr:sulfatase-like hydrolase/transferase [Duncaniella sp.]
MMKTDKLKMLFTPKAILLIEYLCLVCAICIPNGCVYFFITGDWRWFSDIASAMIIALPFVFLPPKWRVTSLIPIWGFVVFNITNLWYLRFANSMIPVPNYFLFGNFDTDLFRSGISMARPVDVVLVIPALLLTAAYLFKVFERGNSVRFNIKSKVVVSVVSIMVFVVSEVVTEAQYNDAWSIEDLTPIVAERYDTSKFRISNSAEYCIDGCVTYILRGAARPIIKRFKDKTLSEDELKIVEEYIDIHQRLVSQTPDSTERFSVNRDKNLIFIVVESLNAWSVAFEYGGHKLMPVLSELISGDGVISSVNVASQVHSGVSSDGQFIYNTGLYPASDATTISCYLDNDLPTLAKVLRPRPSFEVICEGESLWNHDESNRAYGYDRLVSETDNRTYREGIGRDEAMFKTAGEIIDTIAKPFYGMLITMSMHIPFTEDNVKMPQWISDIPNQTEVMKHYLTATNYFDQCLGRFLDSLKEKGLYDNTVIAIASDHTAPVDGSGYGAEYTDIVFAVLNSGMTLHSETPVGQVDVFPTLLQVMGRYNPQEYCGMGLSMLNPALKGSIDKYSRVRGDAISEQLDSMLRLSEQTSNLLLRADKCMMTGLR